MWPHCTHIQQPPNTYTLTHWHRERLLRSYMYWYEIILVVQFLCVLIEPCSLSPEISSLPSPPGIGLIGLDYPQATSTQVSSSLSCLTLSHVTSLVLQFWVRWLQAREWIKNVSNRQSGRLWFNPSSLLDCASLILLNSLLCSWPCQLLFECIEFLTCKGTYNTQFSVFGTELVWFWLILILLYVLWAKTISSQTDSASGSWYLVSLLDVRKTNEHSSSYSVYLSIVLN